eukprot:gene2187-2388_t
MTEHLRPAMLLCRDDSSIWLSSESIDRNHLTKRTRQRSSSDPLLKTPSEVNVRKKILIVDDNNEKKNRPAPPVRASSAMSPPKTNATSPLGGSANKAMSRTTSYTRAQIRNAIAQSAVRSPPNPMLRQKSSPTPPSSSTREKLLTATSNSHGAATEDAMIDGKDDDLRTVLEMFRQMSSNDKGQVDPEVPGEERNSLACSEIAADSLNRSLSARDIYRLVRDHSSGFSISLLEIDYLSDEEDDKFFPEGVKFQRNPIIPKHLQHHQQPSQQQLQHHPQEQYPQQQQQQQQQEPFPSLQPVSQLSYIPTFQDVQLPQQSLLLPPISGHSLPQPPLVQPTPSQPYLISNPPPYPVSVNTTDMSGQFMPASSTAAVDNFLPSPSHNMASYFGEMNLWMPQPVPDGPPRRGLLHEYSSTLNASSDSSAGASRLSRSFSSPAQTKKTKKVDKGNRGNYHCGRCGQLKANHICPFTDAPPAAEVGVQAGPIVLKSTNPWEGFDGEHFLTVRPRI